MRLLLTTDAVGGIWRYSLDLAQAFRARGVSVTLAVLGPAPTAAQHAELAALADAPELIVTGLPLDWTADSPATLQQTSDRLAQLASGLGVSHIQLHAPALVGDADWPAPVIAVAHSCVGTWWRAMRQGPPPPDFTWRMEAVASGLVRAEGVIAPSAAHAAALRAVYGFSGARVVHNGADLPRPAAMPRQRAVLTAGRLWDEAKGAAAIDRAAATLDAPVHAAGPVHGPNGAAVALHHLRLLGTLDAPAMARQYATGSVFVSMARYEPFGLSVLEAAAAGMRLVLADNPTFRELWDGVADFTDEAGLGDALRRALDDQPRHAAGARARAARYSLDRMAGGTLAAHLAARAVAA